MASKEGTTLNPTRNTSIQAGVSAPASRSMAVDPRSGKARRHHLHENVVQKAVKRAAVEAGITKQVGCHTLRHYADASSGGAL